DTYLKVVRGKTAALFSAATEVGGVIAAAPEDQVAALHAYGDALGIAFQIVDDLLDWQGGAGIGKNVGDDFREGKLTLPVIRAIAAGDSEDRVFWTRTLEKRVIETGDQDRALALLEQHGTLESTRADALMWAERAKTSLTALPDHAIRGMLTDLADYVVARLV
ncbi:MAG: polyprenyl synthetase family protein, partial [Alphaproteobacteria bacterium]|nr:polyprenyl synthetase family protein [Alphaproteobacteria bacterium]